jgi:DNA-binding GntR family transcriptional regulator
MRSLTENRGIVINEHEEVVKVLARQDPDAARDAMRRHVLHSGSVLMSFLDEHRFWEQ